MAAGGKGKKSDGQDRRRCGVFPRMRRNTIFVEDDDCRRIDVLHHLTLRGHRVIACASVSDAEEIVRDGQLSTMAPNIVILLLWFSERLGQVDGPDG
jgi:hypothetical protein